MSLFCHCRYQQALNELKQISLCTTPDPAFRDTSSQFLILGDMPSRKLGCYVHDGTGRCYCGEKSPNAVSVPEYAVRRSYSARVSHQARSRRDAVSPSTVGRQGRQAMLTCSASLLCGENENENPSLRAGTSGLATSIGLFHLQRPFLSFLSISRSQRWSQS